MLLSGHRTDGLLVSRSSRTSSGLRHVPVTVTPSAAPISRGLAWMTALLVIVGITVLIPAREANALIGGVVALNSAEDPIDVITADDALFVYLTTDLAGGKVCII